MSEHFSYEQYNYMLGIICTYLSDKLKAVAFSDDPISTLTGDIDIDIAHAFNVYFQILKHLSEVIKEDKYGV